MEEVYVSPYDLKKLIDNGKMVGEGYYGCVFTYQNRLIKLDKILYHLLKENSIEDCDKKVYYRYLGGRENFDDPKQIEVLTKLQSKVKRTKLPEGIIRLKDVDYQNMHLTPGTIIPYHANHLNLDCFPKHDTINILKLLKELLLCTRELEDNGIAQEDMYHPTVEGKSTYNILYKENIPQYIDMSGPNVLCGDNYKDARCMYLELGNVIHDFFKYNDFVASYPRWHTETYEKNRKLIEEFEKQTKGR